MEKNNGRIILHIEDIWLNQILRHIKVVPLFIYFKKAHPGIILRQDLRHNASLCDILGYQKKRGNMSE